MKTWTTKQAAVLGLAAVLVLSLSACGEKKPSLEEVEQAISAGTLTMEDALDKGWVDKDWVENYLEEHSVPASDKMEEYRVGEFQTTTVSGEEFTNVQVGNITLFAFVDPETEEAAAFFEEMQAAFPDVEKTGAGMILCVKGEAHTEQFADAPFPVILLNDSLKEALGFNKETVEDPEMPNTASWYVNGSFLSAWMMTLDADGLSEDAASFVAIGQEMDGGSKALSDSGAAASGNSQNASASNSVSGGAKTPVSGGPKVPISGAGGAKAPVPGGGGGGRSLAPSNGAAAAVPAG